ncbi:unnamed protein product [Lymnaea stagnalis]|uniref:Uncharacterized protein n=1 Tax=Lymnaea stagnalis TaxID=6523 RepID=A0AAV2I3T8_LYMST
MSRPRSESNCELVRMIGPPGQDKSQWMSKYVRIYPEKKYVILSASELCQRMDVVGLPKTFAERRMHCLGHVANECLFRLMTLVSESRRNCIVDDVNFTETDVQEMLWIFEGYERRDISEGINNTAEHRKGARVSETTTESWGDGYDDEEW